MKINRKGVTRLVIELKNVVIKVPNFTYSWHHFIKGIDGNMEEWKIWVYNGYSEERKPFRDKLLCPVLWHSWGGWIVVMKKAKTLSFDEWEVLDYDISEHKKYFGGDDSMSNYGFLNGKLVKIDYASLDNYWGEDFKPGIASEV